MPGNPDTNLQPEESSPENKHPHPRKRGPKPKGPRACIDCGKVGYIEAKGRCSKCRYAWKRDNEPGWFEKQQNRQKDWRLNNPGYASRTPDQQKVYREENRERFNILQRVRRYNLTYEDYQEFMRVQEGKCAICKAYPSETRALAIDHCHTTGVVRGLLCGSCNMGLGKFYDDPEKLEVAAAYLRRKA